MHRLRSSHPVLMTGAGTATARNVALGHRQLTGGTGPHPRWTGRGDSNHTRPRPWDNEGCFAIDYLRSEDPWEPRRAFVRAVKSADPHAVNRAAYLIAMALENATTLRFPETGHVLVAAPGHLAGPPTPAAESLCSTISALIPGLEHRPGSLRRIIAIRQSSTSKVRPSMPEHLASLTATARSGGRSVILVDDVFTLGRTTEACRRILLEAGASRVIVVCLARTA